MAHETTDALGNTVLHSACQYGGPTIVEALMKVAGGRDMIGKKNSRGETAVELATDCKTLEILKSFGAQFNVEKPDGTTYLHLSAKNPNQLEKFRWLIANGANIHQENKELATPLHFACNQGNIKAVQYLVEHGADIDARDHIWQTPLHYACATTFTNVVSQVSQRTHI